MFFYYFFKNIDSWSLYGKFKKNDSPFDFQQYRKSPEPLMMKSIVEKYRPLHYLGENYRTNINNLYKSFIRNNKKDTYPSHRQSFSVSNNSVRQRAPISVMDQHIIEVYGWVCTVTACELPQEFQRFAAGAHLRSRNLRHRRNTHWWVYINLKYHI